MLKPFPANAELSFSLVLTQVRALPSAHFFTMTICTITDNIFQIKFSSRRALQAAHKKFEIPEDSTKRKKRERYTGISGLDGFMVTSDDLKKAYPDSKGRPAYLTAIRQANPDTPFCIVGTFGSSLENADTLHHELTHCFFYLIPEYKQQVTKIFRKTDKTSWRTLRRFLRERNVASVDLINEAQAYIIANIEELDDELAVTPRINEIFQELTNLYNSHIDYFT
jgi:hypothetical protein